MENNLCFPASSIYWHLHCNYTITHTNFSKIAEKNPLLKWNTTGKNNSNVQWTETEVLHLHKGDEEDEAHFHGGSYRSLFSLLRHDTEDTPTSYFWMIFCSCVHLREESSVIMVFLIIELSPPLYWQIRQFYTILKKKFGKGGKYFSSKYKLFLNLAWFLPYIEHYKCLDILECL